MIFIILFLIVVQTSYLSFPLIPTQPKEMNPFISHSVTQVIPLLLRALMHSDRKFQSCGFENSSWNKPIGLSSIHAFINELNFLLVQFFMSFQIQQKTSHMYYKNTVVMRYCYNNFNHKCQICFILENKIFQA